MNEPELKDKIHHHENLARKYQNAGDLRSIQETANAEVYKT